MLDHIQGYIDEHNLLNPCERLGVGVSGGLDSTVLLHLLTRAGYDVVALHVNYGLRDAANGDETYVRSLCERLGVVVRVAQRRPRREAEETGDSLEAVARRQRYRFFAEAVAGADCGVVAVAHHRRDQAETVLLNLFRGSGPEGLAGMPPARPIWDGSDVRLIRPLLAASKRDLREYAEAHDLHWRRDASNADERYRRNALRHTVLPGIEEHFGEAAPRKITEAADLMRAYLNDEWRPLLEAQFEACADPELRQLELGGLRDCSPVWQHRLVLEAMRRWMPEAPRRASTASSVIDLLEAQPGRKAKWPQGTVWRERDVLQFAPASVSKKPASGLLTLDGTTVILQAGRLQAERISTLPDDLHHQPSNVAYVDVDQLTFPLCARPWQDGDRFQPLGMEGSKAVSDLLTATKTPPSERRGVLVLCSEGEIVWVIGQRLDRHARIRPTTRRYVKITYIPH